MRSLLPKFDDLCLTKDNLNPGIMIITETWLTNSVSDTILNIANYSFYRRDRKYRIGGGVCIWVTDDIKSSLHIPITDCPSCCEVLFIRLFLPSYNVLCCAVYIPPGLNRSNHSAISEFIVNEVDLVLLADPNCKVVVAGDFNDFSTTVFEQEMALSNKVYDPTRCNKTLDKIFIDAELCHLFEQAASIGPPIANSDHNVIFLKSFAMADVSVRRFPVWDFRQSNVKEFVSHLSAVDFLSIENLNSVDDSCERFYELLHKCISVIPCEMVTLTNTDKPWITPLLKQLINKRWLAFRTQNWPLYHNFKEKVKEEIIKAKVQWANKHKQNANGLWKIVNEIKGVTSSDSFRHLLHDFNDMSDMLNCFSSAFKANFNSSGDTPLMMIRNDNWNFRILPTEVLKELLSLNPRKSNGADFIPTKLLVIGAYLLYEPLCYIFNHSIQTKTFPRCFKDAIVQPIPKKSRPTVADFRPISLTSIISKVFERLVMRKVKNKLFPLYGLNQHAYRPCGSTTSALVAIQDSITRSLEHPRTIGVRVICLDLSKAFDQLQFNRLLNHLNCSGLCHGFLSWLQSYLVGRKFRVRINGCLGPWVNSSSGVPQGSILGPLLFAAYMGSINFENDSIDCVKYADDITIIEQIESTSQQSISSENIREKFDLFGLSLNTSKCKEFLIQRSVLPDNRINNSVFTRVNYLRILGFIFSDVLSWHLQISDIVTRASRRLYIIRCLKPILSNMELIIVYHSIITSLILYASPTYGNLQSGLLEKLERFQNRAHRTICGPRCTCSHFPALATVIKEKGLNFLKSCELNPTHPLHHYLPQRLPRSNHFCLPHSATSRRLYSFFPWYCLVANEML